MNKMKARREFYTVAMNVGEGMLGYINRVRSLRGTSRPWAAR